MLRLSVSVWVALTVLNWLPFVLTADQPPHIVLILADDLGFNDASLRGSDQIPTPNLDALAFTGVLLNRYYVNQICTPSRSALLTGRYPIHTGMQQDVIYADEPYGLGLEERLLPEHLNRLGYISHAVGKWHLGFFRANYTPTKRGFTSHLGYWCGKGDYFDHTEQNGASWGLDLHRGLESVFDALGEYSTRLFTSQAERVIQQHNRSQPLLLYLAHQAVHAGNDYNRLQAPQESIDRFPWISDYRRRTFAAMLAELDVSVGRVVTALDRAGMLENSIIMFSTDNGGPNAGVDGNVASNWPLRGVKYTLWEGGVRGVGFLWSPLLGKRSYISDHLMHVSDWLPTLYAAAGGDPSDLGDIDGVNLWPALSQRLPTTDGRSELLHNIDPTTNYSALLSQQYKYIFGQPFPKYNGWSGDEGHNISGVDLYAQMSGSPAALAAAGLGLAVSRDQYSQLIGQSVVHCGSRPTRVTQDCSRGCVFDLQADPCEFADVSEQVPEIRKKLQERLDRYRQGMIPPRKRPSDSRANPKYWDYQWTFWEDLITP